MEDKVPLDKWIEDFDQDEEACSIDDPECENCGS
jgi:hypothetical protein